MKTKSKSRTGTQAAGPNVQLAGEKKLPSPPVLPQAEFEHSSAERSSGPLSLGQALDSVSTSVLTRSPVLHEPAPGGRGGHEVVV